MHLYTTRTIARQIAASGTDMPWVRAARQIKMKDLKVVFKFKNSDDGGSDYESWDDSEVDDDDVSEDNGSEADWETESEGDDVESRNSEGTEEDSDTDTSAIEDESEEEEEEESEKASSSEARTRKLTKSLLLSSPLRLRHFSAHKPRLSSHLRNKSILRHGLRIWRLYPRKRRLELFAVFCCYVCNMGGQMDRLVFVS